MLSLQLQFPDGWDTADTTPCPRWALAWWEITRGGIGIGDLGAVGCRVLDPTGRVILDYAELWQGVPTGVHDADRKNAGIRAAVAAGYRAAVSEVLAGDEFAERID